MTSGTTYISPPGQSFTPRNSVALKVKLRSAVGSSEFGLPLRLVYAAGKGNFQLEM